MRFALALDGVALALPSAVTIEQLDEDIGALETPMLTAEEFAEMRELDANVQTSSSAKTEMVTTADEVANAVAQAAALSRIASSPLKSH
jgi:hypothetical protein